jgi:hypothetical protein
LVEPADLAPTMLDWWGLSGWPDQWTGRSLMPAVRGELEGVRDRLCTIGAHAERGIRTPAWYLRITERPELFRKPDDRWEANDVAQRCPEVVAGLGEAFRDFEQAARSAQLADLPLLEEVLLEGLE